MEVNLMDNLKKQPNLGHRAVRESVAWRAAMSLTASDDGNLPPNAVLIKEDDAEG